jgi:hypothetical protein
VIPPIVSYGVALTAAAFAGVVAPWVVMRALVPTLESSDRLVVTNYRGRRVASGLGLVWVVWALGVLLAGTALSQLAAHSPDVWVIQPFTVWLDSGLMPLVLVLGASSLGFADDAFGNPADKGFRGHLGALRSGRLTTGALKLIGIGVLALAVAPTLGAAGALLGSQLAIAAAIVFEALAIALSANLVNLTDLRPGRALKVYSAITFVLLGVWSFRFLTSGGSWTDVVAAFLVLLGPVFAVWRFDLSERAMLGDAGANAAGALVGWLACIVVDSGWPLAVYVAVLLALNIASEWISFSQVIEGNRALSWLDGLGRLPATALDVAGEKSSGEEGAREK